MKFDTIGRRLPLGVARRTGGVGMLSGRILQKNQRLPLPLSKKNVSNTINTNERKFGLDFLLVWNETVI